MKATFEKLLGLIVENIAMAMQQGFKNNWKPMQIRHQKKTWKMMKKESQNGAQMGTNILEHSIKKKHAQKCSRNCVLKKW